MENENQGHTRKQFMQTAAAAGAAAVLAGAGFNRMALAADHPDAVTQLAIFGYRPEKAEEAAKSLADLAKIVEGAEPGVLAYIPHLNEKDNEVVFFEVYENAAALANHSQQPHMKKLGPLFATVFKPPLKIVKLKNVGGFHR
jgi:quinol monooxygenase YgiN